MYICQSSSHSFCNVPFHVTCNLYYVRTEAGCGTKYSDDCLFNENTHSMEYKAQMEEEEKSL